MHALDERVYCLEGLRAAKVEDLMTGAARYRFLPLTATAMQHSRRAGSKRRGPLCE